MKGILLLSAGSKVAITRIAKRAALKRGRVLHASDRRSEVPTRFEADAFAVFDDEHRDLWNRAVLDYCVARGIELIIPTRHGDLPWLSAARSTFANANIALSLCGPETLDLCLDKLETFRFLRRIGAPTPETVQRDEFESSRLADSWPLFAKPRHGAAAAGGRLVRDRAELASVPAAWILQPLLSGDEFTVNLYLDRSGQPLCAIPHQRLAVEAGEVVHARTRRVAAIIDEATRIARSLPDAQGLINIQCFYQEQSNQLQIVEINPRIGGGYPLADQARGHFLEWLCQEFLDGSPPHSFDRWTDGLRMLRYREAFFALDGE